MRSRLRVAALCLFVGLVVVACGDGEPLASPPTASDVASPSASPTPAPSPSPSPSPSPGPSPLSAFEADPAVQGLRVYLDAVAEAINTKNLQLPALLAASTSRRAGLHQAVYGKELGAFVPGPNPLAVVGVRAVSESQRDVLACVVTGGFVLNGPGGTPIKPFAVDGGQHEMLLEAGVWKVNRVVASDALECDGVPIPGITP